MIYKKIWKEERRNRRNNKKLVPNNRKKMYQGNTYIVLDKYEMSDEEHTCRETQEEQMRAKNPNDTILADKLNNEMAP